MSVYWLVRWYLHRLKESITDFLESIMEFIDEIIYGVGMWVYNFITSFPKDIYKMFVWKANPNQKYVNPHFIFFLSFMGFIYFASVHSSMWIIMVLTCLFSLVYGDYIKGEWKGYKRKVEAKE